VALKSKLAIFHSSLSNNPSSMILKTKKLYYLQFSTYRDVVDAVAVVVVVAAVVVVYFAKKNTSRLEAMK